MRLLRTRDLTLVEYFNDYPQYAILSHTWTDEEVTFHDMIHGRANTKKGYQKILSCVQQALRDGYDYVWIDTCCIDKSSSAELSEAINSMYQWYKQSQVCYAYLSDVKYAPMAVVEQENSLFRRSRWFTRGWTLQELLAPREVRFYSADWTFMGTSKGDRTSKLLAAITGIQEAHLSGEHLSRVNIAKRMSWASKRSTTRVEDMAYCLLGIFEVNMPLLYGEGERAFLRLQEEIMKSSEDRSIFAWVDGSSGASETWYNTDSWNQNLATSHKWPADTGLLAPSAKCFTLNVFHKIFLNRQNVFEEPFFTTNKGLCINVRMYCLDPQRDIYVAALVSAPRGREYMVLLRCISNTQKRFVRILPNTIIEDYASSRPRKIFKTQTIFVGPGSVVDYGPLGVEVWLEFPTDPPMEVFRTSNTATGALRRACQMHSEHAKHRHAVSMGPGESRVEWYCIPAINLEFRIVLWYTSGGRCLIRIECDNDITQEIVSTVWKLSGWSDVVPSEINAECLKEWIELSVEESSDQIKVLEITGTSDVKPQSGNTIAVQYHFHLRHLMLEAPFDGRRRLQTSEQQNLGCEQ